MHWFDLKLHFVWKHPMLREKYQVQKAELQEDFFSGILEYSHFLFQYQ
jgi:hypothetical protein